MHKLMIVEDEPLIRAGLLHYFPWQQLGVGPILEAGNGKEGVELALREKPDLIITDIRMPEMDGLSMIERLKPELPDSLFIILTGYNDFAYAQRALKLGNVKNYLLKPLEYEESMATLTDCLEQLTRSRQAQSSFRELKAAAAEYAKTNYDSVVKHLLDGANLDSTEFGPLLELEARPYRYCPIVATCISVPISGNSAQRNGNAVLMEMAERASAELLRLPDVRKVMIYTRKLKLYTLVAYEDPQDEALAIHTAKSVASIWESAARAREGIYLSIGSTAEKLSQGELTLKAADKALYLRYFHPGLYLFLPGKEVASSISGTALECLIQLQQEERGALLTCLQDGDVEETKQLMMRFASDTTSLASLDSVDPWLSFLQDIISVTLRFAHSNGISVEGVYTDKVLSLAFVDDFATVDQLFGWIGDWALRLNAEYRAIRQKAPPSDNLIFDQIAAFIKQRLDEDVTLQMVADRFFYNPSYLSRLFKTKLNKNYMSFVTEIRIEAARHYLRDPRLLVTDVCGMCGYKSYKHFVKTFRGITGMTPTDFRKGIGM